MIILDIILICISISFLIKNSNSKPYKIMEDVNEKYKKEISNNKNINYDDILKEKVKNNLTDLISLIFVFTVYILLLFIFTSKMIYLDTFLYPFITMLILIILYIVKTFKEKTKVKDFNKTKEDKLKMVNRFNKGLNRKLLFFKEILIILFYLIYSLSILINLL